MRIRIMKLVNGDDVICELLKTTKNDYVVKKALRMVEEYNIDKKKHNIYLMQWMPYTNEITITIPKSVLVSPPIIPVETIKEHYIERSLEIFYENEVDFQMTEDDVMLLKDFEESAPSLSDDDETIH